MSVANSFRDYRISAGYVSHHALAEKMECTDEYIRQIERGLKIPSDSFVARFLKTIELSGPAAELFQKLVLDTRARRKLGEDVRSFVGADEVADRLCRDAGVVLAEEIGVPELDVEHFTTWLHQAILSELR